MKKLTKSIALYKRCGRFLSSCVVVFFVTVFVGNAGAATGEEVFKKRCAQCHDLPDPKKLTPEGWIKRLNAMAPMAGLGKKQKADVLEFLQSHSKRASGVVSVAKEQRLFEEKCSQCHTPNRVFLKQLTPESRRHIVQRMQKRAAKQISPKEAETILAYLDRGAPGFRRYQRKSSNGDSKAIFRERCSGCHSLERVYQKLKNDKGKAEATTWIHIVKRMRSKATDWISKDESKQILKYLNGLRARKK